MQNTTKKYNLSVFLFTKDLRLEDNNGLEEAKKLSNAILPIFIATEIQVKKNPYKSMNALQFMTDSLAELAAKINKKGGHLSLFYGDIKEILAQIYQEVPFDALFYSKDYTPFARSRETMLESFCLENKIAALAIDDHLLTDPQEVIKDKKSFYKVFTPFFNRASQLRVTKPTKVTTTLWAQEKLTQSLTCPALKKILLDGYHNKKIITNGETTEALAILAKIKDQKAYSKTRNLPAIATSYLAAHLKFGTISIRQAYHAIKESLGIENPLIKQLYWREFFIHTALFHPTMFGNPMKEQYNKIKWKNNPHDFERWRTGLTGFPIVDAGMRQLNTTGWMHNRVRMITASFLIKDLHIDWQWGEQYFATQLVDYDPAVNNGNWQWCASTGFDAQPYFRIFNPWEQQKKFDPDCIYIKQWIPELKQYSPATIHAWHKQRITADYPCPMIDHKTAVTITKKLYAQYN